MKQIIEIIFFILIITAIKSKSFSQEDNLFIGEKESYTVNPFTDFGKNSMDCFSGKNTFYHLSGLTATAVIIHTGLDNKVHNYFVNNRGFEPYSTPGVYAGYVLPVVLSGGLFAYGSMNNSSKEKTAASAVIQASVISMLYSSALKFFTGRPNPEPKIYDNNNYSSKFRFGINHGGIHYGWPSGHMMTNTAMVTSLMYFYKDNTTINIIGPLYLGYLFLSVISHDKSTMHWFSDAVAGTLMGYAIGSTIGKNFRERYDNQFGNEKDGFTIKISPQELVFTLSWAF